MIRVCIVDDHPVVRCGLRQILSDAKDMAVVDEAETGEEMMMKSRGGRRWDVVTLDLAMPGQGGLETLRQIKADVPRLPVLVLTEYSEEQYAVRALRLGAAGYLTKDSAPAKLVEAVRTVASGARYITPALADFLAADVSKREGLPHESLSNREHQVFLFIAQGRSVTEVARKLGLSVKTVSTNRARLLQKMGMGNNAEVVYYAIKHNLVDLSV
ncbi:MAG TPA: DNA-binding response regulator [Elusimicrobia bacterium]|nr:MAG: DNA-binding response regulator [Elusimicrobia bacterium GWA2_66_18]OGR68417.1 MAG: DNA-binding response regulator [Elusimicrobia bacterium GWC2_65_9]HAZ09038.1 DNA-binding response regulator [Elusimicrobiota bacterium]